MKDLITYEWLLVSTSIPYGGDTKGHMVIEGVGMDADYLSCHRTQIAWGFENDKLVEAVALVNATNRVERPITIVDDNGKCGFVLPGGKGAHAIVSYIFTHDGYEDIKGWKVSDKVEGVTKTTAINVIQTFNEINEEVPVGVPIPWVGETVPEGFLPYTGNGFDVERFPKLGVLFPNGVLLDLTGDVLRAAEVGRAIMSHQEQSVQPLGFTGNALPAHHHLTTVYGLNGKYSGDGLSYNTNIMQGANAAWNPKVTRNDVAKAAGAGTPTGTITGTSDETRMANTAVRYMTKAG